MELAIIVIKSYVLIGYALSVVSLLIMAELIDIKEHKFVTEFFNQSLTKDHLARSYLLTGRDLGSKHQLVKQMNMVLNCSANKDLVLRAACGTCQSCRWIELATHPRTPIYLRPDAESKTHVIKVDQIRELQGELSQSSEFFRIVIIEDASSAVLNPNSSAALLKTIEEAREGTLFMLFAESRSSVLSTIVSRSQVLALNNNSDKEFTEAARELSDELREFFGSNNASSRLAQLMKAEEISSRENKDLVGALQILQNDFSNSADLAQADLVLQYEKAISSLKSSVRPQLVLAELFLLS